MAFAAACAAPGSLLTVREQRVVPGPLDPRRQLRPAGLEQPVELHAVRMLADQAALVAGQPSAVVRVRPAHGRGADRLAHPDRAAELGESHLTDPQLLSGG